MSCLFYTLDDINVFSYEEYRIGLGHDVYNTIDLLLKEISKTGNYVEDTKTEKHGDEIRYKKKQQKPAGTSMKEEAINVKWDKQPAFKATKMETKEGIEKQINDIRILLNKLTDKTYDTHKESIIQKIIECSENVDEIDSMKKITTVLFDIAKSNKFYSELYAKLYKELIDKFAFFNDTIEPFMNQFMDSLNSLVYVDANVNYDGFCNYNKMNENRRASITFIVNLMKNNVVLPIDILDIIVHFQNLATKYIEESNKVNEVDEITEVLSIVISMVYMNYNDNTKWNSEILPQIHVFATYKIKEKPSLSSRSIFKYKDIVDKIKTI